VDLFLDNKKCCTPLKDNVKCYLFHVELTKGEGQMSEFDFYEIATNFPNWEDNVDYIEDMDIRRDLMRQVERDSSELAPTAAHQTGSELEFVDMIFNDQMDPADVVNKLRTMLWNYAKPMTIEAISDEQSKYAYEMDIRPETALDLGVRDSDF